MIEYKVGTDMWLPVRLIDATGNPVVGTLFGSVTATALKADLTGLTFTPPSGAFWAEVISGAFAGLGFYVIKIPAADNTVSGTFFYSIAVPGADGYLGWVKVVANEEVDTFARAGAPAGASLAADLAAIFARQGAPVGASASADLAAVKTVVDGTATKIGTATDATFPIVNTVFGRLNRAAAVAEGHWKIWTSGPDIHRLVLYQKDNVTQLQSWDLKNASGAATDEDIFERVPTGTVPG